jgi:hypothetical protein
MPIYYIILTGSKDGSSSMVALYVNSRVVCGFFLGWQGAPLQSFERSVWDCVGFYRIHTFLGPLVESQFKSFLKLLIRFLVLHIVLHSTLQVVINCCLKAACSFNVAYCLEVGQQA